ncbi:MAG: MaoC family dehydratase N-terminal domain-containing protein [Rhodospirillales bacterium]|nr:MaoC family dehydratase N-terminal domain-containing protein [Rhodospirillales bacterium]
MSERPPNEVNYVTPEVKALIGIEAEMAAWDAVERGTIRRFVQAVMDPDPVYWDDGEAAGTRFGGVIAPPLFPLYNFRFPPTAPDALMPALTDALYHGGSFLPRFGLPDVPGPERRLNGGNEIEFFAAAKPGDRLRARSRIEDIFQKAGRSGPMVFVRMMIEIRNQEGEILLINRQTSIRR